MAMKIWVSTALVVASAAAFGDARGSVSSSGPTLVVGGGSARASEAKPAPVFSVSISGPTTILPNHSCTWYAIASGGSSPLYTYTWVGGSVISQDGNAYEASASRSFYLDLTVTDSNGNVVGTAQKYVTVSSTSAPCMV